MGNPPGYHEGVGSIGIEGYRILALALMSQGAMTAPRSLFVAIREEGTDEDARAICAMWNHQSECYYNSYYFYDEEEGGAVPNAYREFLKMLDDDLTWYIERGVPLTTMMPRDE